MIGRVELLHALLSVTFRSQNQADIDLPFVIDTGFTGDLALPITDVLALQLIHAGQKPATLADSTETELPFYEATIV